MGVLGINVQFIKDWDLKQMVIGFKHFSGSHTSPMVKGGVEEVLSSFNLKLNDVSIELKIKTLKH